MKGYIVYGHSCSCPYDLGTVCKHVAAVLFALRKTAKPKSSEKTFEQTIARMPREDINAILTDYAGREPGLIDYVSARRVIKEPSSNKEEYCQIIRNAVDAVRGRHGYIGYWQASELLMAQRWFWIRRRNFL